MIWLLKYQQWFISWIVPLHIHSLLFILQCICMWPQYISIEVMSHKLEQWNYFAVFFEKPGLAVTCDGGCLRLKVDNQTLRCPFFMYKIKLLTALKAIVWILTAASFSLRKDNLLIILSELISKQWVYFEHFGLTNKMRNRCYFLLWNLNTKRFCDLGFI